MGRKNTSKAATLSTVFRKPLYRYGNYAENSSTVTALLYEKGISKRNVSAFIRLLATLFQVNVTSFRVQQDMTGTETVEVSFHSFASAADFNASPNATEILTAFKQMIATRFGVQVSDVTVTVVDGSAKFQTVIATSSGQVAEAIKDAFSNPRVVQEMFTNDMVAAVDAQGLAGPALDNLNTFFFREGNRGGLPQMLPPGVSTFSALPVTRAATVTGDADGDGVVDSTPELVPFYKYKTFPAQSQVEASAGASYDNVQYSAMFPVNGDKVVHFGPGGSSRHLANLPFAVVLKPTASQSVQFNLYEGQTGSSYTYFRDAGDLSYKYIHNDYSQETEWVDVVFPEYSTWTLVNIITAEFDRDNQHILVKHNDTNQQLAVFIHSIPEPLVDPNAPPPPPTTSATEQFYTIESSVVDIYAYSLYSLEDGDLLRFVFGSPYQNHYASVGGSYYVYVPPDATALDLKRFGDVGLSLSGNKTRSGGTWNIGDKIEVFNMADNNAVVFTLVLTDDYSLGWAGAGLPAP